MVIEIEVRMSVTYKAVAGRQRRLTMKAAYWDAAAAAFKLAHPCDCEPYDHETGSGVECEVHERGARVIPRLARWLMWRDRHSATAHYPCDDPGCLADPRIARRCVAERRRRGAP